MTTRLNWIDWFKVIGMLLIVWGHCFSTTLTPFIYAFNVPVFFFISGYLSKAQDSKTFYNKLFFMLLVPYFILSIIKSAGYMIKHLSDGGFLWSLLGISTGFHHINDASACGNLWFVYTLILIKIIAYLTRYRTKALLTISIISFILATIYGSLGYEIPWAVPAIFLSFPLFTFGYLIKNKFAERINNFIFNLSIKSKIQLFISVLISFVIIYLVSSYNGPAWMYMALYGNNIILFTITSLVGIYAVCAMSLILNNISSKIVITISTGNILILVFHRELLHPLIKWINNQDLNIITTEILMFLSAVAVLIVFVPIIKIVEKYFPILIGNRSSKK